MKLKEIHRTSTFAWSPTPSLPLLATGTVAGALDESFSNESQLEIWAPDFLDKDEYELGAPPATHGPKGSVSSSSRFNRLAWGYVDASRPKGVLAAGMESGELGIWDPAKIIAGADPSESLIMRNTTHTGPIRGLDFNPIQTTLFSSGATNGEIFIWNLEDPSKPYSPGTRSAKLEEVTALAWNHQVPHVLATASSTGYTVVWDLRGKREVVALAYGGGAGTLAGGPAGVIGGRRGMSDVAWHPDNATRLVTSSEDDTSPVVMVWDLRNARAPEKILTGHEKGVLSLSWCKQDADLLLSCGKDNRVLCWNPQSSEIIGELPSADNWAFQVQWCPRNPDLFAAAFFDGTIGVHSIQSTNEASEADGGVPARAPEADGADVFDVPGYSRTTQATLSLKQPPKWLRRPVSATFGYGGRLVSVSNLPSAQGRHQSGVVHIRSVVAEPSLVERAGALRAAVDGDSLAAFAESRSSGDAGADDAAGWRALIGLFRADSRDELITLLGFSKAEVAARVAEAVATLKVTARPKSPIEQPDAHSKPHEPTVVSFAEPEPEPESEEEEVLEADALSSAHSKPESTPSEMSGSAASDVTGSTQLADGESTTTAPSLFGDENIGTPQTDAAADFFSSMGIAATDGQAQMDVPHHNYPVDSSVAATIGSRPSSAMSEATKNNTFRIYPTDESETDRLVTKALVLGDFESAVSLCLSSDRFADAILLAVKGGPELLQRTQKEYFERRTTALPYLRLFQSIVTNDLADIVQNADLQEWQEIFVVLCTFASAEEFSGLAEQLGQRLEFQHTLSKGSDAPDATSRGRDFRTDATLAYLAAGRLERLVHIWVEELAEEEKRIIADTASAHESRYTAHAHALQTFIEKVTVFRSAIKYTDADLAATSSADPDARSYKLSSLYDRYFEYADLLAAQGLVKEAVAFLRLTPPEYKSSPGASVDFAVGRERLLLAAGASAAASSSRVAQAAPKAPAVPAQTYSAYGGFQQQPPLPAKAPIPAQTSIYEPYSLVGSSPTAPVATNAYTPMGVTSAPQYQQSTPQYQQSAPQYQHSAPQYQSSAPTPYGGSNSYTQSSQGYQTNSQPGPGPQMVPPPPRGFNGSLPVAPPPKPRQVGGWNDAPPVPTARGSTPAGHPSKLAPIVSPFPNAGPATPNSPFSGHPQLSQALPPPPRSGSAQAHPPPPPQQRLGPGAPPMARAASGPPQSMAPPPGRGPPQGMPPSAGLQRPPPPPNQRGPPPQRGGVPPPPGRTPPPSGPPGSGPGPTGPYARGTPPPGQPATHARAMSPLGQQSSNFAAMSAPPAQPGPYGPPPGSQRQGPAGHQGPPPGAGPGGPPGPPPGGPGAPPSSGAPRPPPPQKGPPPPKYPLGDRTHIPESARPIFTVISDQLAHLKQITPPQQKRLVDDLERRINPLFDALNCETLSQPVVDQLLVLIQAMQARDRNAAMALHVDLLTRGSLTDDIGIWMSGIKQLIMRL